MKPKRSQTWWVVLYDGQPLAAFINAGLAGEFCVAPALRDHYRIEKRQLTFRKTARERDKSRYDAYLHADSGLSFIEWLKTRGNFYD